MKNGATTKLLGYCISAVMLIVSATFGGWITNPRSVESEDLTELIELMEGSRLRRELRRFLSFTDAAAALRRGRDACSTAELAPRSRVLCQNDHLRLMPSVGTRWRPVSTLGWRGVDFVV